MLLIYYWIRRTREHSAWSAAISLPLLEVLLDNKSVATAGRLELRSGWVRYWPPSALPDLPGKNYPSRWSKKMTRW